MRFKLRKRGGIWHYSGTVNGRRIRATTGTAEKATAERIAAEAESAAWKRRLDGPGATLRFSDCAIFYREQGRPTRHLTKVEDHWKNTLVADITPDMVRRAAVKVFPSASAATRNRQFIVPTQAVINLSAQAGWCQHLKVRRFKVDGKIRAPVTLAWAEAFARHASPHLGALCLFMLATGARLGEALSLTWADIDLASATVKINQTKIGEERMAHLPSAVVVAVANIPSTRDPSANIFGYSPSTNVRKPWAAVVKRARISKLSPHCCRHGFATALLHAGVDPKTVAKLGGWKDVTTVVRTYAHAMGERTIPDVIFGTNPAQDIGKKVASN